MCVRTSQTVAPLSVSPLTLPKQWRHSAYHHSHFPNSGATQRITTHTSQTMAPLSVSSLTLPKQWRHSAYHHSHFPNSGATRRITTHTSKTVAPLGVSPLTLPKQWRHTAYHRCHNYYTLKTDGSRVVQRIVWLGNVTFVYNLLRNCNCALEYT